MHAIEEAVFPEQLPIPKEETEGVPLEIEYDVGNESLCQSELSDINLEIEYDVGNESLCQSELSDINLEIEYDVDNESLCQSELSDINLEIEYDVDNESLCQSELSDINLEIEYDVGNESLCQSELSDINLEEELEVIIFDGMAVLQSMKKNPIMKKIFDLADQFAKGVRRTMKGYSEGRVLFEKYLENSLKMNTRKQRGGTKNFVFSIHDEMNISKLSLKELLSDVRTNADFTRYLDSDDLLRIFTTGNFYVFSL